MLVKFMARRVAVLAAVLCAAAVLLGVFLPWAPVGVCLGAFLGVYRLRVSANALAQAASGAGTAVFAHVALMLASLAALAVSALVDLRLFAGIAVGLLLVPLVICVNALTERAGLTHNAWGG